MYLTLKEAKEFIIQIEERFNTLNQPEIKVPDDVIQDLTQKLKGAQIEAKPRKKDKTPFYLYQNPYTILKNTKEAESTSGRR